MTDTVRLRQVTWYEVLFDLVVVAALLQAGGIASDDLSLSGLARTTLVVFILWWHWTGASLSFQRYVIGSPAASALVAVQLVALLVVAVAVPTATARTADAFVWALVVARLALLGLYLVVEPETGPSRRLVDRYLVSGLLGVVLLVLSVPLSGSVQQAVWGLALLVSVGGTVTATPGPDTGHGHPSHRRVVGEHMVERFALTTVLLLGATGFATVSTLSGQGFSGSTVAVTVFLGVALLSLWVLYREVAAGTVRTSPASVYVWSVAHLGIALGLVLLPPALGRAGLTEVTSSVSSGVLLSFAAGLALVLLGLAIARTVTVGAGTGAALVAAGAGVVAAVLSVAGLLGTSPDMRVLLALGLVLVVVPAAVALLARPTGEKVS